jgi:SAM-dependent methyltransferase
VLYDRIGGDYEATRTTEPRIAARIWAALGDARTVLNVGAGSGNYEPPDREVTAVEPSAAMIAQRPPGAAPVVQATAEDLPFADGEFDAAMAVLSDHHWTDRAQGLREMRRVARRVAIFTFDAASQGDTWLVQDYFRIAEPSISGRMPIDEVAAHAGATRIDPIPIPHDCVDGFGFAFWRRPHAYLDPLVRRNISLFALMDDEAERAGVERLRADLESGAWQQRNTALLELEELDCGFRLLWNP